MKYIVIIFFAMSLSTLFAKGVAAGTVIQNSATLSFSIQEETFSIESNVDKSVVAQLIDVKVSWMDTSAVVVSAGEREKVLTFRVINSGNGRDEFTLQADELDYKSAFSLKRKRIYIDTNKNFRFDTSDREKKTIALGADDDALIFVVSKIDQKLSATNTSQNFVNLQATSRTGGSGEKGIVHKGEGVDGVDAIDGFSGGVSEDEGAYRLLDVSVRIKKNVSFTGGLITVSLSVTVWGEGVVREVEIVDKIPPDTRYVKGTLRLDRCYKSDQIDNDQGRYILNKSEEKIMMSLGELDGSSVHTITYKIRVI